ncbi:MAG: DUF2628 domain-containing protein [Rhodospirillaceae bacterium]
MRVYTVHLRRHGLDWDKDIALVKEGFSWPAFAFAGPWALWHRHWLAAVVLIAVPVTLSGLAEALGAAPLTQAALSIGWSTVVGMLANDWRRFFLERQGFEEAGVAAGRDADEALLGYLRDNDIEAPAPTPAAYTGGYHGAYAP